MKKATTTFVFLISVLVLCPRLSLSAQPDSPATILHAKLEATRDVNQAQQLAIATTKNMSYPQLFDFWEEGCEKTWADVKTAARAEIAWRWKEKPEMKALAAAPFRQGIDPPVPGKLRNPLHQVGLLDGHAADRVRRARPRDGAFVAVDAAVMPHLQKQRAVAERPAALDAFAADPH